MKILAPIIDLNKEDIYNLSEYYKIPIKDTYYCHTGNDTPCGKCVACQEHMAIKKRISEGSA